MFVLTHVIIFYILIDYLKISISYNSTDPCFLWNFKWAPLLLNDQLGISELILYVYNFFAKNQILMIDIISDFLHFPS